MTSKEYSVRLSYQTAYSICTQPHPLPCPALGSNSQIFGAGHGLHNISDTVGPSIISLGLYYLHRLRHSLHARQCDWSVGNAFLVAIIVAHKVSHDCTYSNRTWAAKSQIPLPVLNRLELDFLKFLDWNIVVDSQSWDMWTVTLGQIQGWLVEFDRIREMTELCAASRRLKASL